VTGEKNQLYANATTGGFELNSGTASPLLFNTRQVELYGSSAINNNNATVSSTITINTALTYNGAGGRTLTLGGSNNGINTFAGSITNNGTNVVSLTKADSGRWILGNTTNSYTGATTISGGNLEVSKLSNGGVASSIGQSSTGPGNLSFGGGTLRYVGTGDSTDRRFTQTGSATFDASGSGAIVFVRTNTPAYGTVDQARALTLTGTNTDTNTLAAAIANNGTAANTSAARGRHPRRW